MNGAPDVQVLRFLLVPDASAARRVRRTLAEQGPRLGVSVGTWPELLDAACRAYLTHPAADGWDERLHEALAAVGGAFWSRSFGVAPAETAKEIESTLGRVLSATEPKQSIGALTANSGRIPERARNRLQDLGRLTEALDGALPPELAKTHALLQADAAGAIRLVQIHRIGGILRLGKWQTALVDKINADCAAERDDGLQELLEAALNPGVDSGAPRALRAAQSRLFAESAGEMGTDSSVQWIRVRDFLEEAEVAAGMAQAMLGEGGSLKPADIALLIPDMFEYEVGVADAFSRAGIALSGLPAERWKRDLGREALFNFLFCREKPAPAMAFAAGLTSPLMPWGREQGALLARDIMEARYDLKPPAGFSAKQRKMLKLIGSGDNDPAKLGDALGEFTALLDPDGADPEHLRQAADCCAELRATLLDAAAIDWQKLRRTAMPRNITKGEPAEYSVEGLTVLREGHEPWRKVRHLIVLGFAKGHYPGALRASAVFSDDEYAALREHLLPDLDAPAGQIGKDRERFVRQLRAASETATFLIPHRDPAGREQAPSDSLVFMQQLFASGEGAPGREAGRILELDSADDRKEMRFLAPGNPRPLEPRRRVASDDLRFGRDLLVVGGEAPRPISPSSMEVLLVSRLAWLLARLKAEPHVWAPEKAEPKVLGDLAHSVFENMFGAEKDVPGDGQIAVLIESLLDDAISRRQPFMRLAQWQAERMNLARQTTDAAKAWRDCLRTLGAKVVASEVQFEGTLGDIPIAGWVDAVLELPGGRLLVVDYKLQSSEGRRKRMEKSYDSQVELYRRMLETGGPKGDNNKALGERLKRASLAGIAYYLMRDQTVLSDTEAPETEDIAGWSRLEGDVSEQAILAIREHLAEMRRGLLSLDQKTDPAEYEKKTGIKPYALDKSPLIKLFAKDPQLGGQSEPAGKSPKTGKPKPGGKAKKP